MFPLITPLSLLASPGLLVAQASAILIGQPEMDLS